MEAAKGVSEWMLVKGGDSERVDVGRSEAMSTGTLRCMWEGGNEVRHVASI